MNRKVIFKDILKRYCITSRFPTFYFFFINRTLILTTKNILDFGFDSADLLDIAEDKSLARQTQEKYSYVRLHTLDFFYICTVSKEIMWGLCQICTFIDPLWLQYNTSRSMLRYVKLQQIWFYFLCVN